MSKERADQESVDIEDCVVAHSTEKAILVVICGDKENPKWIPRSLINEESEVFEVGDKGTLVIPEWFAIKEELV